MKKITFLNIFFLLALSMSAQVTTGYYRVQNAATKRYITIRNNEVPVNKNQTDADLHSLVTVRNFDKVISDPGAIIYIENCGGYNHKLEGQGINTYQATDGLYLQIRSIGTGNPKTYQANFSTKLGAKYLFDEPDPNNDFDEAWVLTNGDKAHSSWYLKPIDDKDNYWGLAPNLSDGDYFYSTLYALFPYSITSSHVQVFAVTKVDYEMGAAVIEEVKDEVPDSNPVLIRTVSNKAADNILTPIQSTGVTVKTNLLKGNRFNYLQDNDEATENHNRVEFNPATMRALGLTKDGKIGFVSDPAIEYSPIYDKDYEEVVDSTRYLPANSAYLTVPASCADELRIMTKQEYDEAVATSIDGNITDELKVNSIRDLDGRVSRAKSGQVQIIEYKDGTVIKKLTR